ncbi:hypothetical protein [Streptomyces sp. NPDC060194]|uniref:hypothetical protein n=1 Tax=Streptomyces sp. NPDC060194 TaxID=3347069 RepID=UPI003659147E
MGAARFRKFAKTYTQCPNVNTDCGGRYDGLFIWHVDDVAPHGHFTLPSGEPEYTAAPDGDIYFATALLMASARWGDGSGVFDYRAQASFILNELKDTSDLQPGELSIFNPDNKLVRFIPTWIEGSGSLVDTSYQLPGFYEYWSRNDPTTSNRSYWNQAAGAARTYWRDVLDKAGNHGNGIFPDCTTQDGGPLASTAAPAATSTARTAGAPSRSSPSTTTGTWATPTATHPSPPSAPGPTSSWASCARTAPPWRASGTSTAHRSPTGPAARGRR